MNNPNGNAAEAERVFGDGQAEDVSAPVSSKDRIETLDFIRGLAVMGILAANIIAFGQPFNAYIFPEAFIGDPGDPGGWQWLAQYVLVDGKMRGLFTLLFGAGMYLFMERTWARGGTRWLQMWRSGDVWPHRLRRGCLYAVERQGADFCGARGLCHRSVDVRGCFDVPFRGG